MLRTPIIFAIALTALSNVVHADEDDEQCDRGFCIRGDIDTRSFLVGSVWTVETEIESGGDEDSFVSVAAWVIGTEAPDQRGPFYEVGEDADERISAFIDAALDNQNLRAVCGYHYGEGPGGRIVQFQTVKVTDETNFNLSDCPMFFANLIARPPRPPSSPPEPPVREVSVPTVEGMREADAEQALRSVSLVPDPTYRRHSSGSVGIVIEQRPGHGERVREGSMVRLVVGSNDQDDPVLE